MTRTFFDEETDNNAMIDATDSSSETEEMTKEELKCAVLMDEADIIKGMIEAGNYKRDESAHQMISIKRGGKILFQFRIRPLSDKEIDHCREKCTVYKRNKKMGGMRFPEDTDSVKFRNMKIFAATVDEDKAKTWKNKQVQDAFNVVDPLDVIEQCLTAGEKDDIIDIIDEISGYDGMEEVVKN